MGNLKLVFPGLGNELDLGVSATDPADSAYVTFQPAEGDDGPRRLIVKASAYKLKFTEATGHWTLVRAPGATEQVDVLVVPDGADDHRWRVVSGHVVIQELLDYPHVTVPAATLVRLTADGIEVEQAVERGGSRRLRFAFWKAEEKRPIPEDLEKFLAMPSGDNRPFTIEPADWTIWRSKARSTTEGGWVVPMRGWLRFPTPNSSLMLRPTEIEWDAKNEKLVYREAAPMRRNGSGSVLTLTPVSDVSTAAWPSTGALQWRLSTATNNSDGDAGLALEPVAFPVPDRGEEAVGFTDSEQGIWLRARSGGWLEIRRNSPDGRSTRLRAAAIASESRPCVLMRIDAPGDAIVELLPDNSGKLEAHFLADGDAHWKLDKVVVHEPALRVTLPEVAHVASRLDFPEYPPHERAGTALDLVLLDPLLLEGHHDPRRDLTLTLHAVGERLHLERPAPRDAGSAPPRWRLWQPMASESLDTPPSWAANDRRSHTRPSPLRGLVCHDWPSPASREEQGYSPPSLTLARGHVVPIGAWKPVRFSDDAGRPTFNLAREHLGVEISGEGDESITTGWRYAVGALDDGYRVSATAEPREDDGGKSLPGLATLKSTYVKARYGVLPSKGTRLELPGPLFKPEPSPLRWNAPTSRTLTAGDVVLPFRMVEERWEKDGAIRRWGLAGDLYLCRLEITPIALRIDTADKKRVILTVSLSHSDSTQGRLELTIDAQSNVVRVTGKIRAPAKWILESDTSHRARWLDLSNFEFEHNVLVAKKLELWHGRQPDLVKRVLTGRLELQVLPVPTPDAAPPSPLISMRPDPLPAYEPRVVATFPTLEIVERAAIQGNDHAHLELRFRGGKAWTEAPKLIPHGSRFMAAWAGRAEFPEEAESSIIPGIRARALTRLLLELERGNAGLEIVGGMLGWEAGELYGLEPPDDSADVFPQLTMKWPSRGPDGKGDAPRLELNGAWRFEHAEKGGPRKHKLVVNFWDVDITLAGRTVFEARGSVELPALVRHQFPGTRDEHRVYAFQTGRVEGRKMDLSAVLFVEQRDAPGTRLSVAGLRKRGLKGFKLDHAPPARLADGQAARDGALLEVVCGPAKAGDGLDIESMDGGSHKGPRLSWTRGIARVHETAHADESVGVRSAGPAVRVFGASLSTLAEEDLILSTLVWLKPDDKKQPAWLPCPIFAELDEPAAPRRPRLWVIEGTGLTMLHEFDPKGASTGIIQSAAKAALVVAGWHREAALEYWTNPGDHHPTWELVDSPLLNRSVSLHRFTSGAPAPDAILTRREDVVPASSEPTPLARVEIALDAEDASSAWVPSNLPHDTSLIIHRAVPFELGARQGLTPGERAPAAPWIPAPLPADEPGRVRFLPPTLNWHPAHARPGERQGFALGVVRQEDDALSASAGVEMRFPRWHEASIRVHHVKTSLGEGAGVLASRTHQWFVSPTSRYNPASRRWTIDPILLLRHAPGATSAHPADAIRAWIFGPAPSVTLELVTTLPDDEEKEANKQPDHMKADLDVSYVVRMQQGEERVTRSSLVTLQELANGRKVELDPKVDGYPVGTTIVRAELVLKLPDRDWATGDKIGFKVGVDADGEKAPLTLDTSAPRATAPIGLVGIERAGRLLGFGPEPSAYWIPQEEIPGADGAPREVRWIRSVQWEELALAGGEESVPSVFYIEPSGYRVDSEEA